MLGEGREGSQISCSQCLNLLGYVALLEASVLPCLTFAEVDPHAPKSYCTVFPLQGTGNELVHSASLEPKIFN